MTAGNDLLRSLDTSRRVDHPASFESVSEALDWLARVYRKDLWTDADCVVQVWLEKDALTGVLSPVTHKYGAHRGAALARLLGAGVVRLPIHRVNANNGD